MIKLITTNYYSKEPYISDILIMTLVVYKPDYDIVFSRRNGVDVEE